MMPFMGLKGCADGRTDYRLNISMILKHSSMLVTVYLCFCCAELSVNVYASRCLYICPESVSLHKLLYVSSSHEGPPVGIQGVSLVRLHGVWCLCSNDQQVCSIVSACSVAVLMGEECTTIHGSKHLCKYVCECMLAKITSSTTFLPFFFSSYQRRMITAPKADAMSVTVLAFYSCLPWDQKILNRHQNTFPCQSVAFDEGFALDTV